MNTQQLHENKRKPGRLTDNKWWFCQIGEHQKCTAEIELISRFEGCPCECHQTTPPPAKHQIKDSIAELAYESIKRSPLWEQLDNATCDTEAEKLAAAIERVIDGYLAHRLANRAESARIEALTGLTSGIAPQLKSLREVQSERDVVKL